MDIYRLGFPDLSKNDELWSSVMLPQVQQSLADQGCTGPDRARYSVAIEVDEGAGRPCKDVDNYYKPIIDTVTYSKLLWHDDEQVDENSSATKEDR